MVKNTTTFSSRAKSWLQSGWDPLKCWRSEDPTLSKWRSPCFTPLTLLQNVENLKPFHPSPPKLVDGEEEVEVEDILTHRLVGHHKQPQPEYLVRFKGCSLYYLWLPQLNLEHAPEILRAYRARQTNNLSLQARPDKAQLAPSTLRHMGHMFYHVELTGSAATKDSVRARSEEWSGYPLTVGTRGLVCPG